MKLSTTRSIVLVIATLFSTLLFSSVNVSASANFTPGVAFNDNVEEEGKSCTAVEMDLIGNAIVQAAEAGAVVDGNDSTRHERRTSTNCLWCGRYCFAAAIGTCIRRKRRIRNLFGLHNVDAGPALRCTGTTRILPDDSVPQNDIYACQAKIPNLEDALNALAASPTIS
jgi:hypothetical protein